MSKMNTLNRIKGIVDTVEEEIIEFEGRPVKTII